jgi:CBS domain-containing protein
MTVAEELAIGFDALTAGQLMEKDVQFGYRRTKGDVLASLMIEGFGSVPIVDGYYRLVGIVTEFDLLAALDYGEKLSDVSAQELMTRDPVRVMADTSAAALIEVLRTHRLIRVPVVDRHGKLMGIVARRDILKGYLASNPDAAPAAQEVIADW